MNNNHFISVFGTFGSPHGFKQSYLFLNDARIANSINTFDLNTNAIMLFPNTKMYSIRKEMLGSKKAISYSIYSYAKEPNSDRNGTFIGSSFLFADAITEESITINLLNDFHDNLIDENVKNETITVNHSDNFSVTKPKDFDKISFNLKSIDRVSFNQTSNKVLVVFCYTTPDKLKYYFEKSLDLLNVYDTIYFTQNKEVADYIRTKGIFKIVDEKGFEEVLVQEITDKIKELETAKQELEADRKIVLEKFYKQIEQNELKQRENEQSIQESKTEINTINQKYTAFSTKIDELISQLQNNGKLENSQRLYAENKDIFLRSIRDKKELQLIATLKTPEVVSQLNYSKNQTNSNTNSANNSLNIYDEYQEPTDNNSNIFKILSLFFGLIIIGLLVTYFYVLPKNDLKLKEAEEALAKTEIEADSLQNSSKLNPEPNSEIDSVELSIINNKLIINTKIDSVATFILKANPSTISEFYKYQKSDYKILLYEKNKDKFSIENQDTIYINSLKVIPNFRK